MKNLDPYNICIWGDSITWGAWDYEKGGWVNRLHLALDAKQTLPRVTNLGISGNTTKDLLKRFLCEAEARNPGFIIFAIGINDSCLEQTGGTEIVSIQDFEKNYEELLRQARQFTDQIVLIGLTWYDESSNRHRSEHYYYNKRIQQYDAKIKEIGEKNNLTYIHLFDILTGQDLEDGLHPNTSGHKKIFEKVMSALLPLIGKREVGREIV